MTIIWHEEVKNGVTISHPVTQAEYDELRRQRDELLAACRNLLEIMGHLKVAWGTIRMPVGDRVWIDGLRAKLTQLEEQ